MTLILSGTAGLSDVDGTAATPAIRGTDTNTGIFFPAADTIAFAEGGVESGRLDSSGNFGVGVVPAAWSGQTAIQVGTDGSISSRGNTTDVMMNAYYDNTNYRYVRTFFSSRYQQQDGTHRWAIAASGTAGAIISFTEAARIDTSGNFYFNSGYGSSAVAYACRAWVNFNGTGTVAIRASANVSSITDGGVGDYTVNFTTAMPDANYAWSGSAQDLAAVNVWLVGNPNSTAPTTSALRFKVAQGDFSNRDVTYVDFAVFR